MTTLTWDADGDRLYETGIDRCVLYLPTGGVYSDGYAWNGITGVTESPSGAEANAQYADNIKYLNLLSVEELGGTIEAFMYPDEFAECDGSASPATGVSVTQQRRKAFGLAYRTRLGNDIEGNDYGYKLHLLYGAQASPSEKAFATVNDSPEPINFSWEFTTTPVAVTNLKPTSLLVIDSTSVAEEDLAVLEEALYGTELTDPRLPLPDEVIAMFTTTPTVVTTTTPTFVSSTGVITIPTVTGVTYRRADTNAIVTGTVTIAVAGDSLTIKAYPSSGAYVFSSHSDDDWSFTRDD